MNKSEIINSFAELYHSQGYAPLQGKIVGLFFVSEERSLTFQEIQDKLGVSKGAISKAINPLLEYGIIKSETKPGNQRRRYFNISPDGWMDGFSRWIDSLCVRRSLLVNALELREDKNEPISVFIKKQIDMLEDTIPYLRSKVEENNNNRNK